MGGRCVACGMTDIRILEFDHILDKRVAPRVTEANGQALVYQVLAGNTDNLQLLCPNCHALKTLNLL
jgi:5-methylcytosine-specific restriction endonuclease McrA